MENASKALLMAGGMLIALLIIGSLVLMFANLQNYQNNEDISAKQAQIAEYNNQFEPYNKDELTLMELKSVYNKIVSNNKKHLNEYEISTNIKEADLNGNTAVYPNIDKPFTEIDETDKQNKKFKCIQIEYGNVDGRISSMIFEEVIP